MSIIAVLPEELSNRIAAGEVVERPSSVVKELFENAVDAHATTVTVEIERAGSRMIRVSDNGCGMDENDARLCFSPHATSKIKNVEDIERITTLGFRGEALPSIASVSKLSLKTRTAESTAGIELQLEGGKLISQKPIGMPIGTVFTVHDLFYNVPARKKFLRSPATEEAHIQEMVIALALGFPQVAVTLKFDNKIAFQTPGERNPSARVAGLFGKNFASKMLNVDYQSGYVTVSGLIASPGFTRTSRREQRTFVNGRAVESPALYRGIRDGYGTLADFGRFPPTILNIELDAGEYDINVHPTKREVRFKKEYLISRAITDAIRQTLQLAPAPEIQLPDDKRLSRPEMLMEAANINYSPSPLAMEIPGLSAAVQSNTDQADPVPEISSLPKSEPDMSAAPPSVDCANIPEDPPLSEKPVNNPESYPSPFMPLPGSELPPEVQNARESIPKFTDRHCDEPLPVVQELLQKRSPLAVELTDSDNYRYIGTLFGTFVLIEMTNSEIMYMIDFHAAHERVLYEELLNARTQASVASQQLLLPPAIELSRVAAAFIDKNEKLFASLGFDIALLSSNTVLLNAVPATLSGSEDWENILTDLVNTALEGEKNTRDSLEAIARAACHSAVKANDPLNEITAQALLKSLSKCQRPDVCPHGRPTVLKITKNELSRRFGRI